MIVTHVTHHVFLDRVYGHVYIHWVVWYSAPVFVLEIYAEMRTLHRIAKTTFVNCVNGARQRCSAFGPTAHDCFYTNLTVGDSDSRLVRDCQIKTLLKQSIPAPTQLTMSNLLQAQISAQYMDNVLSPLIKQIKKTYNSVHVRELFHPDHITHVFVVTGGLCMEIAADDEAINLFTSIQGKEHSGKESTRTKSTLTQKRLTLKLAPNMTLHGHYTFHPHTNTMHTHFRFSPTRDGMLALLKLFDHSVDKMMKAVLV